jgi:hypothetical protein
MTFPQRRTSGLSSAGRSSYPTLPCQKNWDHHGLSSGLCHGVQTMRKTGVILPLGVSTFCMLVECG